MKFTSAIEPGWIGGARTHTIGFNRRGPAKSHEQATLAHILKGCVRELNPWMDKSKPKPLPPAPDPASLWVLKKTMDKLSGVQQGNASAAPEAARSRVPPTRATRSHAPPTIARATKGAPPSNAAKVGAAYSAKMAPPKHTAARPIDRRQVARARQAQAAAQKRHREAVANGLPHAASNPFA